MNELRWARVVFLFAMLLSGCLTGPDEFAAYVTNDTTSLIGIRVAFVDLANGTEAYNKTVTVETRETLRLPQLRLWEAEFRVYVTVFNASIANGNSVRDEIRPRELCGNCDLRILVDFEQIWISTGRYH